jgi:enamine deaminase RidA (YjgF/YER057c/UK114 family)
MASSVADRLARSGVTLPPEPSLHAGVTIPFCWVRRYEDRLYVSGHGALTADGAPAGPFGTVPSEVSVEQAQESARQALASMLASLQRTLGDLDRIRAWLSVTCFVNADPGFELLTLIANPMSSLIIDLFGPDRGAHARTSPGIAALPFGLPVIVAAELAAD